MINALNKHLDKLAVAVRRTTKNGILVLIGVSGLTIAHASAPATYCAFEVRVTTPSGAPRPNVLVGMLRKGREHDSVYYQATTDAAGLARLCDAPLEVVDIYVGNDVCGSVLVKNLPPTWPDLRHVYITYAEAPCGHFVFPRHCRILLRIQDESGRALSGARLEDRAGGESETSDVYGRLFRLLKGPGKLEGVVAKEGSEPALVSLEYSDDTELKVVLRTRR